jgi:hypothetical protein
MALPGQPSGVSQTSFIFATVFGAYVIYITLRGDLAKWLGVFGMAANAAPNVASATAPNVAAPGSAPAPSLPNTPSAFNYTPPGGI